VDGDGLPVGLQVVAARHRDDVVLRTAHALYEAGAAGVEPPDGV
jgi:aspartyl-tRNA(Asn)/glutamyl-tRNA(Gln) amidotransferase subunit A